MESVFLLFSVLFLLIFYVHKKFRYWGDRGVPFLRPTFPFGNLKGVTTKVTITERHREIYLALKGKGPVGGMFFFLTPQALILDLDLLQNVFVKDFEYFQNRGMVSNERKDPLSANLLQLEGSRWRHMRAKLTPTFTSGKLKMMHSTLMVAADQLKSHLHLLSQKGEHANIKELSGQFTTDVICSVAFGIDCNSFDNPDNEFRRKGKQFFETSPSIGMMRLILLNLEKLVKFFNLRIMPKSLADFFLEVVRATVEHREKCDVHRNDFIQLLLQIKNTGQLDGNDLGSITMEELGAQAFLFFLAGYETSSATMTFACYELATHPEIQRRTREEIHSVLQRHGGEVSYDALMEMPYLDQVINETLRKYPVAGTIVGRKLSRNYHVPGSDLVLEKGMFIKVPVLGIHYDPDIYPEPEKFDPDRFTKENVSKRHPNAFIPFGKGPRNCIGLRLGMMQVRIGLVTILRNFEMSYPTKRQETAQFTPSNNFLSPKGGMFLRFDKL